MKESTLHLSHRGVIMRPLPPICPRCGHHVYPRKNPPLPIRIPEGPSYHWSCWSALDADRVAQQPRSTVRKSDLYPE